MISEYIEKMNAPEASAMIVKRILQICLEKEPTHRQYGVACLAGFFKKGIFKKQDIRRAFDLLYNDIHQILIDVPMAITFMLTILKELIQTNVLNTDVVIRIPSVLVQLETYVWILVLFFLFFEKNQ